MSCTYSSLSSLISFYKLDPTVLLVFSATLTLTRKLPSVFQDTLKLENLMGS